MRNPKVFISHASEDKERFVLDFAKKLRAKGIDVWMDKWEILLGDDLVDKVFEEGIKQSQVVIVILSRYSINKKWPKAERDVAVIKRINKEIRLIPVILDIQDDEVPESMKAYRWIRIRDFNNYEDEFNEIVKAVYEYRDKPSLGEPPKYTQVESIPGLEQPDVLILKLACEKLVEVGYRVAMLSPSDIGTKAESFGLNESEVLESLQVLDQAGYIRTGGVGGIHFEVTEFGFDVYCRAYVEDYASIQKSVGLEIENQKSYQNKSIAKSLGKPQIIIDHVLRVFESKGFVKLYSSLGGDIEIYEVSPLLRRWLRET